MTSSSRPKPVLLFSDEPTTTFDHALVRRCIKKTGMRPAEVKLLSNGTGWQYVFLGGAILTLYRTGRYLVQGTPTERERRRLDRVFRPLKE